MGYSHGVAPAVHAVATPVVHHAVAAPVVTHHTVPVVQYGVKHTVQHIPQVSVHKQVSTHTTHHVINHAPVVGSYVHSGLPVVGAAAVVAAEPAAAAEAVVESA